MPTPELTRVQSDLKEVDYLPQSIITTGLIRSPGVYAIVNSVTQRLYIGSTKSLEMRRSRHASLLRLNSHWCKELQSDFNLLGSDAIIFKILRVLPTTEKSVLQDVEQFFIDRHDFANLYNACPSSKDWSGAKHRPVSVEKLKRRSIPDHVRTAASLRLKGKPLSEQQKRNISLGSKGKPKSVDHAQKLRRLCIERNLAKAKKWKIIAPDGDEFVVRNLNAFCKENALDQAAMYRVAIGKVKQHKGWKCFYVTE
jgi:group I intron endonuclease